MCFQWKFFEICILELFSIDLLDSGGIEESICFKAMFISKSQKIKKCLQKPRLLV